MPVSISELLSIIPPVTGDPAEAKSYRSRTFVAMSTVNSHGGSNDPDVLRWVIDQFAEVMLGSDAHAAFVSAYEAAGGTWRRGTEPLDVVE